LDQNQFQFQLDFYLRKKFKLNSTRIIKNGKKLQEVIQKNMLNEDPWDKIPKIYHDFGAFIEIEPGIDGL